MLVLDAVAVTRSVVMARGEPYTPEDDAIVLRYANWQEGNAVLKQRGRPERTRAAYKARRSQLLREKKQGKALTTAVPEDKLARISQERAQQLAIVEAMRRELDAAYERLAELEQALDEAYHELRRDDDAA